MDRRTFLLSAAGAAACAPAPEPDRNALAIQVTGVEVFTLRVNDRGNWVVIRVQTDAGLTGLGDASHSRGGRNDPAIPKVLEYVERMKGRSIFDLEWLKQQCAPEFAEHGRATSCSWSAIEQALFDIQGQALGVPCWAFFGGKQRDAVRNYANINRGTDDRTPAGFAANTQSAIDAGFDAVKMATFDGFPRQGTSGEKEAFMSLGVDCARAAREVLGDDADLLIDAHNNFTYEEGTEVIRRLEPLNLFWLEEISRPLDLMGRYNAESPIPIAGGESLFMLDGFLPYVEARAADILMPDVKYCGGMRELSRICALAESAGMSVAPHGPATPVGNMAAAQVCVTIPNYSILEFSHSDAPWRAELVDPPEPLSQGGMLAVGDTPGLGYKLNEKTVQDRLESKEVL